MSLSRYTLKDFELELACSISSLILIGWSLENPDTILLVFLILLIKLPDPFPSVSENGLLFMVLSSVNF